MTIRDIVQIDEEKCDGCGLCVPGCEEGAIKIIGGKAKVVSDVYCDGLGACLGHCPQGAISIVQRDAESFDEQAVAQHLANQRSAATASATPAAACGSGGCPGSAAVSLTSDAPSTTSSNTTSSNTAPQRPAEPQRSQLTNWPVQLHLVPPHAPYLYQADLLLVADCVPFACAEFHTKLIQNRPVVIGCPKLDDCGHYVAKLAAILRQAQTRSISVAHMEVPCCTGLLHVAKAAIEQAGVDIVLHDVVITTKGEIIERGSAQPAALHGPASATTTTQLPIL